jgi:hypothetical protein
VKQSELTQIGKPSEDELLELVEMEREVNSQYEDFVENKLNSETHSVSSSVVEKEESKEKDSIEIMRNIFPKYLETLFSGAGDIHNEQLRTMEIILLKELKVSFE